MSYVTQDSFTGAISSILKTIQDLDNHIANELQIMNTHINNNTVRVDYILNDPTKGLNAVNKGLSQAYVADQALDQRITQLEDEILAVETYVGMPQNTRSLSLSQQLAGQKYQGFDSSTILTNQINQLQQQQNDFFGNILAPLKALGTGLGIGTGALLIGAGLIAVMALRR